MDDNQQKIDQLLQRLESLIDKQHSFAKEIHELRTEINQLKREGQVPSTKTKVVDLEKPVEKKAIASKQSIFSRSFDFKADLEKFIGENLINKIGIAITVIGVGIGVKYSIDHDLITPLTRILLGYLAAVVLLGLGIKLKPKYKNYSAVLVSGAMAMLYFITYAGYSFYDLIPQLVAFGLMVIFTIFTVIASISYDQQVIGIIGLVGAYAVPFLLSTDSGNVKILFSYMAIINAGILIIAFRKYWKMLYYSAFILSWAIFIFWYSSDFDIAEHYEFTLIFLSIFFLIFYVTFLAYKLLRKEEFLVDDILLLLANSFIYFGFGYAAVDQHESGEELLGLFTIWNAMIHFIVSIIVFRQKLSDRNLFFLVAGLVLVFITIAIPVQLDGRWVTLLWIGEAALLFWIGRTKNVHVYEKMSYVLMVFAFFSLMQDWLNVYNRYIPNNPEDVIRPVFNVHFLSSWIFIIVFAFITWLYSNKKYPVPAGSPSLNDVVKYAIPGILLFTIFFAIRMEIYNYWNQLYALSAIEFNNKGDQYMSVVQNTDLISFRTIWLIDYSLIFLVLLSIINIYKIKSRPLALMNLGLNALVLLIFLIHGLYALSELRESYITQHLAEYYHIGRYNLIIRYISLTFVVVMIIICYRYLNQEFLKKDFRLYFDIALHFSTVWILSSELIHWLDLVGSTELYKLGLSILWGAYSLLMIVLGIWKHKKYLRIGAISLFAITLVKLFLYDVSELDTILKTILFVSLGSLLLIISFLYNKYKHIIADENKG